MCGAARRFVALTPRGFPRNGVPNGGGARRLPKGGWGAGKGCSRAEKGGLSWARATPGKERQPGAAGAGGAGDAAASVAAAGGTGGRGRLRISVGDRSDRTQCFSPGISVFLSRDLSVSLQGPRRANGCECVSESA